MELSREGVHYLAGPYRGAIFENVHRAALWAAECAKRRILFISPHMNSAFMDTVSGTSDQYWLDLGIELLRVSQRVLMEPGWQTSKGSCDEYAEAKRCGIPVYAIEEYLEAWDAQAR